VQATVAVILYLGAHLLSVLLQYVFVGALVMHYANVAKVARSHKLDFSKLFFAQRADV
jgi:hypothetical protein